MLYIWNILSANDRLKAIRHYGICILNSLITALIDWQNIFLLWGLTTTGDANNPKIIQNIIVYQVTSWVLSFWYYYIKHQNKVSNNELVKTISNNRVKYITTKITNNAAFQWIDNIPTVDLARQITLSNQGITSIFQFSTTLVRLSCSILVSLSLFSVKYASGLILLIIAGLLFKRVLIGMWTNKLTKSS